MDYKKEEEYLIWLSFLGLTQNKTLELLSFFGSYEKIFLAFKNRDSSLNKFIDKDLAGLCSKADENVINTILKSLEDNEIMVLTKVASNLPKILNDTMEGNGVTILFCKGNVKLLHKQAVGVVGSRNVDNYGISTTIKYVEKLTKAGLVIVSGLAAGVDSLAHETCLKNGGETIAVLASGFNNIYPAFNKGLAEQIVKNNGLLVSEYPPNSLPLAYLFPIRNRVIAGLSEAILITQMGEKSGAMHTFNYALDYNHDVFVVPADVNRKASLGSILVLREYPFTLCCHVDDVLAVFDLTSSEEPTQEGKLTSEETKIINALRQEELTKNELAEITGLEASQINGILTTMQIEGKVNSHAGKWAIS